MAYLTGLGKRKKYALRLQTELVDAVKIKSAGKYPGGFNEVVERLLVGEVTLKRGLSHRYPRKYSKKGNGK